MEQSWDRYLQYFLQRGMNEWQTWIMYKREPSSPPFLYEKHYNFIFSSSVKRVERMENGKNNRKTSITINFHYSSVSHEYY